MTAQVITTGTWMVDEAKEAAFLDAWAEFAASASESSGATTLRLGRDSRDPRRFVSFAAWESADDVNAWKTSLDMQEGLAQVVQHVDEFDNTVLEVIITASSGQSELGLTSSISKGA